MLRPEVVRRRLEKVEEFLEILRSIQAYDRTEFLADPERYGSAERFLQLAIESINDVASHVAAARRLGPVEASRDLPRIFLEQGVVPEDLARRWTRMIGFRNILVHNYLEIDRDIVFDVLHGNLEDLERLAGAFAAFLAE